MKIIFLQFPLSPAWGGAEEHTLLLTQGLKKAGHEVRLVSSNKFLLERFQKEEFAVQLLWTGWEPTSIRALLLFPITVVAASISFLILFLKESSADTIFCLSLTDKLVATPFALLFGKKVFWIEHTRLGKWIFQNPLKYWHLFLCRRKIKVVAPSYFSRNQLLQLGVPIEQIKVIYHGIPRQTRELPTTSPSLDGRGGGRVIGYLGRLTAEKGAAVLINALAQLPHDTSLIIGGLGPEATALKKLSNDLGLAGRIKFIGRVQDKQAFFQSIDSLVIPSVQAESFGLVAVEAMAASVPVIASRIGALPEIIEDQKTGLLFEPGSSKQLAEKILWTGQNPTAVEKIIEQAHTRVATLFSEKRMLLKYLELVK